MHFSLKKEQLEQIGNYLITKPYQEVVSLINILNQARPINIQEREEKQGE